MEFTRFDIAVLVIMPLAIVAMAFTFPALGLTSADHQEEDIPEFNVSTDRFDIAGEAPRSPGTPTQGTMFFDEEEGASFSDNQIWLDGDTSNGTEMVLTGIDDGQLTVNNWTDGNADTTNYNLTAEGDTFVYQDGGYEIAFEVTQYDNTTDSAYYEVEYTIRDEPADTGWFSRVPVIGTAFDAAAGTAAVLAWVGSLAWWTAAFVIEFALNSVAWLYDATAFMFGLLGWMSGVYSDVISSANSFVRVFVAIPGILLSLVFSKVLLIGISLLPTT